MDEVLNGFYEDGAEYEKYGSIFLKNHENTQDFRVPATH